MNKKSSAILQQKLPKFTQITLPDVFRFLSNSSCKDIHRQNKSAFEARLHNKSKINQEIIYINLKLPKDKENQHTDSTTCPKYSPEVSEPYAHDSATEVYLMTL